MDDKFNSNRNVYSIRLWSNADLQPSFLWCLGVYAVMPLLLAYNDFQHLHLMLIFFNFFVLFIFAFFSV